jgi:TonB family protein
MSRAASILAILLGHVGVLTLLEHDPIAVQRLGPDPGPMLAEVFLAEGRALSTDMPPLSFADPRIELDTPEMPMDAIPKPQIEAPKIDPEMRLCIAPFASRAELPNGEIATVLLMLQVAADGSVISADVVRGSDNEVTNAAAIDYARATRWIPGAIDGEPRAMQASLMVILGESACA